MRIHALAIGLLACGFVRGDITDDQARQRMEELNRRAATQPIAVSVETQLRSENRTLKEKNAELEAAVKQTKDELIATQKKLDDLVASIQANRNNLSDPLKTALQKKSVALGMTLQQARDSTRSEGTLIWQVQGGERWKFWNDAGYTYVCDFEKGKCVFVDITQPTPPPPNYIIPGRRP